MNNSIVRHILSKQFWNYVSGIMAFGAYLFTWQTNTFQNLLEKVVPTNDTFFGSQPYLFLGLWIALSYVLYRKNEMVGKGFIAGGVAFLLYISFVLRRLLL